MSILFVLFFAVALVFMHLAVRELIRIELDKKLRARDELTDLHSEAVHEIRDELRRSSRRLIATALDPTGREDVIDVEPLDRPRR